MGNDYSLTALKRFLDYTADKGLMKRETAMSRKRAADKILSALDEAETEDLRNVDLEEASRRFINLQGSGYKPESLRVYNSRLKSAVTDFFEYVNDPTSFKPSVQQRSSRKKAEGPNEPKSKKQSATSSTKTASASSNNADSSHAHHDVNVLTIPIPVRDGVMVQLRGIPADLTAAEAEKIANVVKAYATIES